MAHGGALFGTEYNTINLREKMITLEHGGSLHYLMKSFSAIDRSNAQQTKWHIQPVKAGVRIVCYLDKLTF